jgi:hypothetical protein
VHAALDRHPIALNRDAYLKRTLALELMRLDRLEMAFEGKAIRDRDVAAGVLMVKIAERRAKEIAPAAADVAADIEAGPAINRRVRRSFDRHISCERRRSSKRQYSSNADQDFLHGGAPNYTFHYISAI